MRLHRSGEDYLEAILILEQKRGYVRSSDVAEQMNVTKPSVTFMLIWERRKNNGQVSENL